MADNEQQMVLTAKLVDQISDKLKVIQQNMMTTASASKKLYGESGASAQLYAKRVRDVEGALHDFHNKQIKRAEENRKHIENVADAIKGMISGNVISTAVEYAGRLGAIGLAAGVAYEGIKRVSEAVNKLGTDSAALNKFAAASAMSVEAFQKLTRAQTLVGVPESAAKQGNMAFADWWQRFKQGQPSARRQIAPPNLANAEKFASGLDKMSPEDAERTLIDRILRSDNTPAIKSRLFGVWGLDPSLAGASAEEWREKHREAPAVINKETADAADKAHQQGERLKDQAEKLWNSFIGKFSSQSERIDKWSADRLEEWNEKGPPWRKATPSDRINDAFSAFSDRKFEEIHKRATTEGVVEGLRQFKDEQKADPGGYRPMAYHPGSDTPSGLHGSSGHPLLEQSFGPAVRKIMGDDVGSPDRPGSGVLAVQRAKFREELKHSPALRNKIMRIMANEQGGNALGTQGIAESMMNRALVRGTSLAKEARWHRSEGGYYDEGSMGRGALENPRTRAILERSLENALAGSDAVGGATDNSSGSLAARERATGKFRFIRGIHGESFFAPGWAERGLARRWDAWHGQVETMDAQHGDGTAHLGHHIRHRDLLKNARTSGLMGPSAVKLSGDASVSIDLNGFPRGTRTSAKASGLFKEVNLNRGRSMVLASEDS